MSKQTTYTKITKKVSDELKQGCFDYSTTSSNGNLRSRFALMGGKVSKGFTLMEENVNGRFIVGIEVTMDDAVVFLNNC